MEIYLDLMKNNLDKEYFYSIFEDYCTDYGIAGLVKLNNMLYNYLNSKMMGDE